MRNALDRQVYIVDGLRSPWIKYKGVPGPFTGSDLGVHVCRHLANQYDVLANVWSEVVSGCVMPRASEMNIARVISLRAGLNERIPAMTVQRNCASGLQALDTASFNIHHGISHCSLVGGTEAMSYAPLLFSDAFAAWIAKVSRTRDWLKKAQAIMELKPHYLRPVMSLLVGLNDPVACLSMGQTAENLAYRFQIDREAMDAFALSSHQRATEAEARGYFSEERLTLYDKQGQVYDKDDGVRADASLEALAKLAPQFDKPFGLVTAGNSSQITDGAAFMILADAATVKKYQLPVRGKIRDVHWAGVSPAEMGLGPAHAIVPLLQRQNIPFHEIDYWEINEAFAGQVLAVRKALNDPLYCQQNFNLAEPVGEIPMHQCNVDGGAIALGHPVGASGARLVLHLLNVLERHQGRYGIASLCIGGGQGGAMLIERVTEVEA